MEFINERIRELEAIDVKQTKEDDFDSFWEEKCQQCKAAPLNIIEENYAYPWPYHEVRKFSYTGLDKTRVNGLIILPAGAKDKPVPCMIAYHGLGGSAGYPSNYASWAAMGLAVIAIDCRLQKGDTSSNTPYAGGTSQPQAFTMNILDRDNYYYLNIWTDALQAVEVALSCPEIDSEKIGIMGGSQGGGTVFAVSALHKKVALCLADVPSNCWLNKRVWDRAGGANAIAQYLRTYPDRCEQVHKTLSYFDHINHAPNIKCPVLVSTGLKDPICPPENVYAAYNKITSDKRICYYPFGEHDGGGAFHEQVKLNYVYEHFFK